MISPFEFLEPPWRRWRRWIGAGMVMATLHVGGAAAALWQWPEEEFDEEPEGAMVLELAPMAVATREEMQNLMLGPLSDDVAPTPPVEEVREMRTEELPPVDEAPLVPNPEVAFEKIKPVEELEEPEEKPPQELVQAQLAPASIASAPPPIESVRVSEMAAAPLQGSSRRPNQAQLTWQKALHLHLNRHKRYPAEARNRRVQGVVTVAFSIDSAGTVTNRRILKGSGSPLLDSEALEMLTRASPLPVPPEEHAGVLNLSLPIQFNIR